MLPTPVAQQHQLEPHHEILQAAAAEANLLAEELDEQKTNTRQ
jgi:hypothetical protein